MTERLNGTERIKRGLLCGLLVAGTIGVPLYLFVKLERMTREDCIEREIIDSHSFRGRKYQPDHNIECEKFIPDGKRVIPSLSVPIRW